MSEEAVLEAAVRFEEAVAALGRSLQINHALATETGRTEGVLRRVLTFELAEEEYAIDLLRIREIVRMRPITEVPRTAPFLAGIVSLRGTVLPVLDLRRRMRLPAAPTGTGSRILVVYKDDEPFGLIVDRVRQVVRLRDEEVEPPPPGLPGGDAELLAGIGRPGTSTGAARRLVILVDLDAVLTFDASANGGGLPGDSLR